MMGITAVAMVRGRRAVKVMKRKQLPLFRILIDGALVGFVTGLVGAGGGFLVVPALVLLGGMQMRHAVATSLLVVSMKSLAGFAGYALAFGGDAFVALNPQISLDLRIIGVIVIATVVGSMLGSALSIRSHPDRLRRGFGWFVLTMAILIFTEEAGAAIWEYAGGSWLQMTEVILGVIATVTALIVAIRWPATDVSVEEEVRAANVDQIEKTS